MLTSPSWPTSVNCVSLQDKQGQQGKPGCGDLPPWQHCVGPHAVSPSVLGQPPTRKLDPATNVLHHAHLPLPHIRHFHKLQDPMFQVILSQPPFTVLEKFPSICSACALPTKRNLKRKYFVEIHPFGEGDGWWWRNFYKCVNGILDDPFLMNHMKNNNTSTAPRHRKIPGGHCKNLLLCEWGELHTFTGHIALYKIVWYCAVLNWFSFCQTLRIFCNNGKKPWPPNDLFWLWSLE